MQRCQGSRIGIESMNFHAGVRIMKLRNSVVLMALALLIAYTIPAASAECARQGEKSCGKPETSCDSHYSSRSYDRECAESCAECGSCGDDAGYGNCPKDENCAGERWRSQASKRSAGMRHGDRKSYQFAEERDFQRLVDNELKLCACQKISLAEKRNAWMAETIELQRLYFADRSIGIEGFNHRLTLLNRRYDRCTRKMLSPLQDTVFPEHMWVLYSSSAWNKGFHPGFKRVLREMLEEHERDFRKHYGKRGKWVEGCYH